MNTGDKKVLMICVSLHHGNTAKIAEAMGKILAAGIIKPSEAANEDLAGYDIMGFGSGIYNRRHHQALFDLADKLPAQNGKKAFIFSTNTFGLKMLHEPLRLKLAEKGFDIVDEFTCPGHISHGIMKYWFGGLSKGRPNEGDLQKAREFAEGLKQKI